MLPRSSNARGIGVGVGIAQLGRTLGVGVRVRVRVGSRLGLCEGRREERAEHANGAMIGGGIRVLCLPSAHCLSLTLTTTADVA